jgi:hypothetical protein
MEKCKHCQRDKPDYGADMTCGKGGYCEWEETQIVPGTMPLDVSWADGGSANSRVMHWSFPERAIIQGLEVEPNGSSYHGFISSMRIGNVEYLYVCPFPFLMWSPGMPAVELMLPHVPIGSTFTLETSSFRGKVRPRGLLLIPEPWKEP